MKLKQIIKNKWGWILGIIFIIPMVITFIPLLNTNNLESFLEQRLQNATLDEKFAWLIFGLVFSQSNINMAYVFYIPMALIILVRFILGFVIGLILEKLWRKFK